MGSSSETASQILMYQQPAKINNQPSKTLIRLLTESSNISPSVSLVSSPNSFAVDAPRQKSIHISAALEHCYENVEKDETGRILNRDADSFQVRFHIFMFSCFVEKFCLNIVNCRLMQTTNKVTI